MFDPYAVTVGGVKLNDSEKIVPWDSTRPAAYVDVAAFANKVVGVSGAGSDQYDTDFTTTAASASIGAGVSGLLKAEMPVLTGEDIEEILKQTARDAGSPGRDDYTGTGAIDAEAALSFVRNNDVQRSKQSVQSITSDEVVATEVELNGNRYWDYVSFDYQNCPKAKGELHKFKARIPYSQTFSSTPDVWVRWGGSDGVVSSSTEGVSYYDPLAKRLRVISADRTGLKIEGYYWKADYFNSAGGQCAGDVRIPKKANNFKIAYTAIGTEDPPPVDVSITGPTYLDEGEQGTWTAEVSGGSGNLSYQWYEKYDADTSFNKIYGATSASYSTALYGNVTFKVEVTADNSSDSSTHSVSVDCNRICVKSFEESLTTTSGLSLRGGASGDRAVTLTWQASSAKVQSSGAFTVQHRADSTGTWSQVGTVPVSDSSSADSPRAAAYRFETDELEIGTHQFRVGLPQDAASPPRAVGTTEADNARRYTGPVTAQIAMEAAYRLSTYPNPVQQQATVKLAVKEPQEVQVHLYDLLGRRVATLHNGPLPAQELRRLRLDVSSEGLTSGTYFLRVSGEDVAATEQITVVR
jgi:hypothetical protein